MCFLVYACWQIDFADLCVLMIAPIKKSSANFDIRIRNNDSILTKSKNFWGGLFTENRYFPLKKSTESGIFTKQNFAHFP